MMQLQKNFYFVFIYDFFDIKMQETSSAIKIKIGDESKVPKLAELLAILFLSSDFFSASEHCSF